MHRFKRLMADDDARAFLRSQKVAHVGTLRLQFSARLHERDHFRCDAYSRRYREEDLVLRSRAGKIRATGLDISAGVSALEQHHPLRAATGNRDRETQRRALPLTTRLRIDKGETNG
jgi:hypothetical protein